MDLTPFIDPVQKIDLISQNLKTMEILGKDKPWIGKEDDFQKNCINFLRLQYRSKLFFHVPNGGKRNRREGVKFKAMGVLAGVSDVLILEPTDSYHGLIVELKVKGGRVEDSQKEFLENCEARGFKTVVAYSLDAFMDVVNWYFKTA